MIKVDYFLLCEGSLVDSEDRYTLINIFDCVTSRSLPVEVKKLVVAFSITAAPDEIPEKISLKIQFLNPKGAMFFETEGEAERMEEDPTDPDKRLKVRASVDLTNAVPFDKYGTYHYRLLMDDIEMQTNTLEVLKKVKK